MDAALQLAADRRPRFELDTPVGPALVRLRRAVRSLLGQRGGVMLLWMPGGAEVRIDCGIEPAGVVLALATADERMAACLRDAVDALRTECARQGLRLDRCACTGPVQRPIAA